MIQCCLNKKQILGLGQGKYQVIPEEYNTPESKSSKNDRDYQKEAIWRDSQG